MAVKKQKPKAAEKVRTRQNTPLLFLLLILIPLYGGYYNFSTLLAGAVLVPLLLYELHRTGRLCVPTGGVAVALGGVCLGNLLAVPFSVSAGMAFTGFLRSAVWVLFFLYAATYAQQERREILDVVAWEGAILSLLTTVVFLYNGFCGVEDANGRIDGLFEYANTWALYLLVCLILLALGSKHGPLEWGAMAVLLTGIFLSGSRGIFLLLFGLAGAYALWYLVRKRRVLPLLLVVGGAAALFELSVVLSGGLTWDRLRAITLTSSSLNGRLLYYMDGLRMIWDNPMGVGRGGFLYIQPLYQTGVYTLRYIHNEYFQAALDGGLLAGVCTVLLPVALLVQKHLSLRERAVILCIAAHALIDFDFQFTAVVLLMLLCGSGGRVREIALPKRAGAVAGGVLTAALCYFSLAYFMDFCGQAVTAHTMFPADLSLAENRLQSCAGVEEGEPVADRILASTDLSMLAWDCKFAASAQRLDGPEMARTRYQYLRLNGYRGEVYEEFTQLLENLSARGSQEELKLYSDLANKAKTQLEEVRDKTSPLAYRIADKPDLEFADAVIARLKCVSEKKG